MLSLVKISNFQKMTNTTLLMTGSEFLRKQSSASRITNKDTLLKRNNSCIYAHVLTTSSPRFQRSFFQKRIPPTHMRGRTEN